MTAIDLPAGPVRASRLTVIEESAQLTEHAYEIMQAPHIGQPGYEMLTARVMVDRWHSKDGWWHLIFAADRFREWRDGEWRTADKAALEAQAYRLAWLPKNERAVKKILFALKNQMHWPPVGAATATA